MKKKLPILFLFFFYLLASREIWASFSRAVVETQIKGGPGRVYQSVETTVNGETIRKESTRPGRLELEMKKEGEVVLTPFVFRLVEFFRRLFTNLISFKFRSKLQLMFSPQLMARPLLSQ